MREGEKKKKNGLGKKQRERGLNTVDTLLMDTSIKNTAKWLVPTCLSFGVSTVFIHSRHGIVCGD